MVVRGTFQSPLYESILKNDFSTYLKFWYAYNIRGSYAPSLYYLKGFDGVAVVRTFTKDRRTKFDIDSSISMAAGILGASLSAAAGLENGSNLKVESYQNFIFVPPGGVTDLFSQAPKPSFIAKLFKDQTSILNSPIKRFGMANGRKEAVIFDGELFEYWYDLEGVPAGMCNSNFWSGFVNDQSKIVLATPSVEVFSPDKKKFPETCRFSIKGYLASENVNSKNVNIVSSFVSQNILKDSLNTSDQILKLDTGIQARVSVDPKYIPQIGKISHEELRDGTGKPISIQWRIPLQFEERERSWDRAKANQIWIIGVPKVKCDSPNTIANLSLTAVESSQATFRIDPVNLSHAVDEDCDFAFRIQLPLSTNTTVERDIQLKIRVPKSP